MTQLTTKAADQSTYVVTAVFTDAAGASTIPTVITWTLSDRDGTIINSREDVEVATPAATISITLSGADLDFDDGSMRVITIEATYDSTEGTGLPLKDEAYFSIKDLINV